MYIYLFSLQKIYLINLQNVNMEKSLVMFPDVFCKRKDVILNLTVKMEATKLTANILVSDKTVLLNYYYLLSNKNELLLYLFLYNIICYI
jgi:hypothetical protein